MKWSQWTPEHRGTSWEWGTMMLLAPFCLGQSLISPWLFFSPLTSIHFPNFSHSCPSNPEEKYGFCLYLFCEGSAPDSSAKTVKRKERFNQVAPGNTCAMYWWIQTALFLIPGVVGKGGKKKGRGAFCEEMKVKWNMGFPWWSSG